MTRMHVCFRNLMVCMLLTAATVAAGTRIVSAEPKEPPASDNPPPKTESRAVADTQLGAAVKVDKQPQATGVSVFSGRMGKYVQQFDEQDDKLARELERLKKKFAESRERGWKPPWGGLKRLRSRADYEKMSTADLAKECFSTSVWAGEIFIHNHPTYGIARAGVFHDGLSVLYERPDFWDGMVAVYKELGDRMGKAETEHERMGILFNLQTLR